MKNVLLWSSVSSRSELVCLLCWATMSLIFSTVWRDTRYGRESLMSAFYIIVYICVRQWTNLFAWLFMCYFVLTMSVLAVMQNENPPQMQFLFFFSFLFLSWMVNVNLLLNVANNPLFYKKYYFSCMQARLALLKDYWRIIHWLKNGALLFCEIYW